MSSARKYMIFNDYPQENGLRRSAYSRTRKGIYKSSPNLLSATSKKYDISDEDNDNDDYGFLKVNHRKPIPSSMTPKIPPLPKEYHHQPQTNNYFHEQQQKLYWENIQQRLYEFYQQHRNHSNHNIGNNKNRGKSTLSMTTRSMENKQQYSSSQYSQNSSNNKINQRKQTVPLQSSNGSDGNTNWIPNSEHNNKKYSIKSVTTSDKVKQSAAGGGEFIDFVYDTDSTEEEAEQFLRNYQQFDHLDDCNFSLNSEDHKPFNDKSLCVKCLVQFFNSLDLTDPVMSRISSKDTTSGLSSRNIDGESSSNLSGDKKKPFTRPFSKTRLEPSGSSVRMSSPGPTESSALLRQNHELRQRLHDDSLNYRRRLETYKQAQSNQAALVSRLQAKVLQYKQRCSELEGQMHDTPLICPQYGDSGKTGLSSSSHAASISTPIPSTVCPKTTGAYSSAPLSLPCTGEQPTARHYSDESLGDESFERKRIEEERKFCDQLIAQNNLLRQQLEESHRTNESLTNDLQKLTNDWESLRDEMLAKEDEWKCEEEAFNEYYNNEHSRLLKMWKEVVSVKRIFKEMATSTKMELGKMRCEIAGTNREVSGACSGVSVNIRNATKVDEAQQMKQETDNKELKMQLQSLKNQYEAAKNELMQRDQKLQHLMQELKMVEDRCMSAENQCSQMQRLNDEIDRLNTALRDIAHAVVQDADAGDASDSAGTQHLHLSQSSGIQPTRSPKRGPVRTSQAFAESTISAVQASLHKYQLVIHDLQVKLQSNTDALQMTKKQLESTENTRETLTSKVAELTDKLDTSNYQLSEIVKERDSLQKTLDNIRSDKHSVERGKAELNSIVDSLNIDYEKLQHLNSKLQKAVDLLEDEKKSLMIDLQRVSKDKDILEMNLRAEEERSSRLREETITLREELNKLYLSRDLLEQQRIESDGLFSLLEKQKMDLEYELEKLQCEKNELSTQLEKKSSSGDNMETEIKDLKSNILQLEDENRKAKAQNAEQTADIASLKKELLSAEQVRLDLESEKLNISEKLKMIEIEKEKVEQELGCITRERGDISNQLTCITRKKEAIGEEIMRLRQRLEQANEMNNRLNRNLEELVKENEEKQVIIEAQEKDLQRLQEQLASLRSEKESLEAVLFDTNTTLEATEAKKVQLEQEVQDLLVKQENLKSQVARLMKDLETSERRAQEMKTQLTNAAANQEADFLQKIAHLKSLAEDNVKKLNEEKEQIRMSLEKRMQQAMQTLESNKDAELQMLKEQMDNIQMHFDAAVQQHEEVMIRAENDKQQALLLAHRDKQAVIEKLESVSRDLKTEVENGERLRREMASKGEKDRNAINALREEITKLKSKMEEHRIRHEEELNKAELLLASVREERENASKEIEELKVQIRLTEDKCDSLNNQLVETVRKLREAESAGDISRKELTDTRRSLADSNIERDKYATSNKELRDHIKRVEGSRREQSRSMEDALQKITSLEETRNTLENDKVRLSTLLKEAENSATKLQQDLATAQSNIQKMQSNSSQKDALEKEMQARLNNEIEEKERICQELHQVKKQMSELDTNLHSARQELGRVRCKASQDDHRFHSREQELIARIEDGRGREKRLEDQKHNLEVCLADATQQIQELKARLGGAEGRVRALDDQLMHAESIKKEAEIKLSSIGHTLRRIAGVQLDGTVQLPYRLLSPSRRYSPARNRSGDGQDYHDSRCMSMSTGENAIIDVDPEMVRKGVRTLMHQVAMIERERDDFKAQLNSAKKQINEQQDAHNRQENKLGKLQQNLRGLQDEKANLESKLNQKLNLLASVEEQLKNKTDELNTLREKVTNLELSLSTGSEEKAQCDERLDKCRQNVARLETEKRHLQDELNRAEGRASKLDLQRVTLEGEVQRCTLALQEKEGGLRSVQERLEQAQRGSAQLEDRCVALKTTVDQLKDRLQAAAITETELRGEISGLQRERTDQGHHVAIGQDKIKQIQKSLTNSENERRVLAERLDQAQNTINELRRTQQSNQDNMQRMQEQLAEMEVQKSSLESQLRIAKWNQENPDQITSGTDNTSDYGREKADMRRKIDSLNEKVRILENEKRYGGGGGGSSKFSGHVQFDRSEKSDILGEYDSNRMETDSRFTCGLDHSAIENENRDLRMKVRRLETQLAEKEAELARMKAKFSESSKCVPGDAERYRQAQLQAERLLDARESSHRQQILRLENQISMLREQLAQEAKRRQLYILRSSRAGREMQQLRQTLGDSLRNVAQEPIDPILLENETRRLDSAVAMSSLPPSAHCYDRSLSPNLR